MPTRQAHSFSSRNDGRNYFYSFVPFQIAELLTQLDTLRGEMNNLPTKMFQRQYSDLLIAYVQILGGLEFINDNKLARSAKATLAN